MRLSGWKIASLVLALAPIATPGQQPPTSPQMPTGGSQNGLHGQPGQGHGMPPREASPFPDHVKVPKGGSTFDMSDLGGRPVIRVMINGQGPYALILDTGASITVLDSDLQKELALPRAEGVQPTGHMDQLVQVKEMRVGDVVLQGMACAVNSVGQRLFGVRGPRGVLSASSFPGHLLSIDYRARRISVEKGKLEKADDQTIFQYRANDPFPTVTLRVAGQDARVHVDTGSGYGILLPTRYLKELPLVSQPTKVGTARTHSGDSEIWRAAVNSKFELGKYTLDFAEADFADIAIGGGQGNIGFEVLRRFVVTLDSKSRRIRFSERSEPAN